VGVREPQKDYSKPGPLTNDSHNRKVFRLLEKSGKHAESRKTEELVQNFPGSSDTHPRRKVRLTTRKKGADQTNCKLERGEKTELAGEKTAKRDGRSA